MHEAHPREARFGDLRRADRVIGAGNLAAALRIQASVALAKVHEAGLHPVGDAEIEVPAVRGLEEARGAEVVIGTELVDVGPEFARGLGDVRLTWQIFAALYQWRREAEVEAKQSGFFRSALDQPAEH